MQNQNSVKHGGKLRSFGIVASVLLAPALLSGYMVSSRANDAERGVARHPVRIEVTLKEFAISPDPLRIPAGEEVVLVIKNEGLIPHEFMGGREADDGTFAHDLFEGIEVTMSDVDPDEQEAGGHEPADMAEHAEAAGHEHPEAGGHEEAGGHGDAGEHGGAGHGTMVTAEAGKTMYMSFTLPESRRGEWSTGCFLPGHYEAGMHGTLIVE